MKPNLKLNLTVISLFAASSLIETALNAQTVLQRVALSGASLTQSSKTTDVHGTTTTSAPSKRIFTTAALLQLLAHEEFVIGNLPTDGWPAGAALYFNGAGFEVDKGNSFHLDLGSVMTWSLAGTNDVSSGSYSDKNGPGNAPYSSVQTYLATITVNSKDTGGAVQFHATGLATLKTTATAPSRAEKYTLTRSLQFSAGTGEGSTDNGPIVILDLTLSASGSASENVINPG